MRRSISYTTLRLALPEAALIDARCSTILGTSAGSVRMDLFSLITIVNAYRELKTVQSMLREEQASSALSVMNLMRRTYFII